MMFNQYVTVYRENKTVADGEVTQTYSRVDSIHCHMARPRQPVEGFTADKKKMVIDQDLTTSYNDLRYRDVIKHRQMYFRVQAIGLVEGSQRVYTARLTRDTQVAGEIV